jgi:hypothetical protein
MRQDPALREDILREYAVWRSIAKVAEIVHASPSCVYGTLKRNGVVMNRPGGQPGDLNHQAGRVPHDEIADAVYLYDVLGWSTHEVGERYGICHTAVLRRLRLGGARIRTRAESNRRVWARRATLKPSRSPEVPLCAPQPASRAADCPPPDVLPDGRARAA